MSCPTCDHTMEGLGISHTGERLFVCPRCGTIKAVGFTLVRGEDGSSKTAADVRETATVPHLVGRCRGFRETLDVPGAGGAETMKAVWKKTGIAEAINKPGDRPT